MEWHFYLLFLTQPGVKKIIENNITKGQMSESYKDFKPLLYNVWKLQKMVQCKPVLFTLYAGINSIAPLPGDSAANRFI